jgi:RimK family alpha-L-glutamate ligase
VSATVAILTDTPGWHGRRLQRAFAAMNVGTVLASLSDCRIDLDANRWGIVIPGCESRLPDAVLVREIAAGTFEQVTLRLGLLHALAEHGVPVCNSARAIERSVDKSMTSMLLRKASVPTPPTWVSEQAPAARATLLRETARGHRVVAKPLFGSQGKGLRLLGAGEELPDADACGGVFYLQRYVPADRDYRVFVIGGEPVATMARRGTGWVHNVALGAQCEAVEGNAALGEIAVRAVAAIGMDYAGVDVICDEHGALLVIEVNGIPAWRGLQSVASVDIAAALVRHVATRHLTRPDRVA